MGSTVAEGIVSDGHGLVLWVPFIADPKRPTQLELTDDSVVDLTYLLFADGFDHQIEISKFESSRYTLAQVLEREGTRKDNIVVKYPIKGGPGDIARVTLEPGATGWIVERLGVPNDVPIAAGQYLSVVAPVRAGTQKKMPVTSNTEIGKEQELLATGTFHTDVFVAEAGTAGWAIEVTGTPTGGEFTLAVNGFETAPIAYNATSTAVQAALNALQNITGVTATVSTPLAVTFSGAALLEVASVTFTGGDDPDVIVSRS